MRTNLDYHASVYCLEYPCEDDSFDYSYYVDVSLQDIIEYLFKEKYEKDYNPLSWYLEDGAREFVKDIEDSWLRDDIDEYGMLQDLSLRTFLKDKYASDVENELREEHWNYLYDEYNDNDINVYCEVE